MGDVSMAEKPTIVLVHGAWHTADCWSLVTSQLKEYGYPFKAVQLPSSGGGLTVTVEEDAAHIRKTTSQLVESGKDVILAVHSYGGIPGTDSAKGLLKKERLAEQKSGGIISIVYITAFLVPVGATLGGFIGGMAPWVKIDVGAAFNRPYNCSVVVYQSHCAIANKTLFIGRETYRRGCRRDLLQWCVQLKYERTCIELEAPGKDLFLHAIDVCRISRHTRLISALRAGQCHPI